VRSTGRYAAGEESMAYATEAFNESKVSLNYCTQEEEWGLLSGESTYSHIYIHTNIHGHRQMLHTKTDLILRLNAWLTCMPDPQHEVRVSGNRMSMSASQDQEVLRAIAEGKRGSRSSALGYASATDGLVSNYEYDRVGESRRGSNGWRSSVRDQTGYDARGAAPEQDYI
jgi:hypothetical protein